MENPMKTNNRCVHNKHSSQKYEIIYFRKILLILDRQVGRPAGRSAGRSVGRSVGRSIGWSVGRWVVR